MITHVTAFYLMMRSAANPTRAETRAPMQTADQMR